MALPVLAEDDGGEPVTFAGQSAARKISLPSNAKPGDVLWTSGPSDPMPSDFESVLFQGVLADAGIAFQASVRDSTSLSTSAEWSPWVEATVERFPNGRFWARFPISGKKAAGLRMRIVHKGMKKLKQIELFGMELVTRERENPPPGPQQPYELPVSTGAEKPPVGPRESWGAEPAEKPYEPMVPVRISIHHTEAAQPMTEEDAVQELKIIQRFHKQGRGWIDIGYHFLIDGSGRIWQGRPETVVGAHVRNKNEGNVGISLMGSFHEPKNMQPTEAQLKSVVLLARWLSGAYEIDPALIKGHRDQQSTSCPGDILYAKLDDIRRQVATPPPAAVARLRASDRVFEIIDGNILRSLVGPEPDLKKLRELDDLFNKNRGH